MLDQPEDDGINVTIYLQWNRTNPSFIYTITVDAIPDIQTESEQHRTTLDEVNNGMTTEIKLKVLYNYFYNVSIVAEYLCERSDTPFTFGLHHCKLIVMFTLPNCL